MSACADTYPFVFLRDFLLLFQAQGVRAGNAQGPADDAVDAGLGERIVGDEGRVVPAAVVIGDQHRAVRTVEFQVGVHPARADHRDGHRVPFRARKGPVAVRGIRRERAGEGLAVGDGLNGDRHLLQAQRVGAGLSRVGLGDDAVGAGSGEQVARDQGEPPLSALVVADQEKVVGAEEFQVSIGQFARPDHRDADTVAGLALKRPVFLFAQGQVALHRLAVGDGAATGWLAGPEGNFVGTVARVGGDAEGVAAGPGQVQAEDVGAAAVVIRGDGVASRVQDLQEGVPIPPRGHVNGHVLIARGAVRPLVHAADFQRGLCGDVPLKIPALLRRCLAGGVEDSAGQDGIHLGPDRLPLVRRGCGQHQGDDFFIHVGGQIAFQRDAHLRPSQEDTDALLAGKAAGLHLSDLGVLLGTEALQGAFQQGCSRLLFLRGGGEDLLRAAGEHNHQRAGGPVHRVSDVLRWGQDNGALLEGGDPPGGVGQVIAADGVFQRGHLRHRHRRCGRGSGSDLRCRGEEGRGQVTAQSGGQQQGHKSAYPEIRSFHGTPFVVWRACRARPAI